ncbi:Methyltransferase domain-containing protein [Tenacibaculum sp. MAR_2009_124]|uniref:class I SAM-dependent methyltransferase n=1 Tax=Tenacibaculum sp. MAR_2009_124 TaxID=1250059 RepID=UPI000897583C|nr:class I SAM-dependent methyltransferase [Tenacibaculum sp. MAR_2009_124]SEC87184.1 Methyltransferase domain-containing protein [Tenacibaculum sp. MAR_2009_124]
MKDNQYYFDVNRKTWNKRVALHAKSDMYKMDSFKKGATSLMHYEIEALGDVQGKSLLHLQCHFGQDTLSWSRRGAKCTGIDISEEGIQLAIQLNSELNLDAEFICCNVYDVNNFIDKKFDIVFTSYGTIGWLPNLKPWAKVIASRLNSGGVFFMAEFHPIVWMFDYLEKPPKLRYGYNQEEVIYEEYSGTYADSENEIISKEYGWNHGLGEVISALTKEGLVIEYLKEHDESPYQVLPDLTKVEANKYVTKDKLYPLIFTLKVTKP